MKSMCVKVLLVFVLLCAATAAHADVMVNNLTEPTEFYAGPIGNDWNTNDFFIGQEFTLPAGANPYQVTNITLLLNVTGGGANITVSLWNAGPDNNPTNEIAVVASRLAVNAGNVSFVPSNNITLSPGIYYVVAAPKSAADSGLISWAYATVTNWTGAGALDSIADTSSGAWENYSVTNLPQQMSVEATPVAAAMKITQHSGNTTLSWPAFLSGYVVDTATNLPTTNWLTVTNVPIVVASTNNLTNSWSGRARFFRLRQNFAVDNLEQPPANWDGPIGTDNNSSDFLIGQKFALPQGNYLVNKVTLPLTPVNGNGNVTVGIWNVDINGNPGTQIATVASAFVSSTTNVNFAPSTPIPLSAGTYYVVASPTTPADNGQVGWYWTISTTWTGFGAMGGYAATYPGSWQNAPLSAGPFQMSVQATRAN